LERFDASNLASRSRIERKFFWRLLRVRVSITGAPKMRPRCELRNTNFAVLR